jgi:hypothetical protein
MFQSSLEEYNSPIDAFRSHYGFLCGTNNRGSR